MAQVVACPRPQTCGARKHIVGTRAHQICVSHMKRRGQVDSIPEGFLLPERIVSEIDVSDEARRHLYQGNPTNQELWDAINSGNSNLTRAAARSPHLDEEMALTLARCGYGQTLLTLAHNQKTPTSALNELFSVTDVPSGTMREVRRKVLAHPLTDVELAIQYAESTDPSIVAAAASHPLLPQDIVERLCDHEEAEVRASAVSYVKSGMIAARLALTDARASVRACAVESDFIPGQAIAEVERTDPDVSVQESCVWAKKRRIAKSFDLSETGEAVKHLAQVDEWWMMTRESPGFEAILIMYPEREV